jgi:tetratricopeptide (TPR) repeat protein
MKDKTIAAILAFFGGIIGLQRFYLGQRGVGLAHVFFFVLALSSGPSPFTVMLVSLALIFGIIDAISFLSMEPREFDLKYNQPLAHSAARGTHSSPPLQNARPMTDRERRFQERQRQRAERERERERRAKERFNQRAAPPIPNTRSTAPPARRDPGRADRERGVRLFKDYEYAEAITAFQRALEKNPQDIASHFNISCAYSVQEEADRAFYHLDRAVALGFTDFDRIQTHDNLAYLRIQKNYPDFVRNDFRLAAAPTDATAEAVPDSLNAPIQPTVAEAGPVNDDLLEQLQRLAALREKGLLTEREFTTQKRRLLG